MAGGSGKVPYGSDLVRRQWFREGLIQKSTNSFWSAYKGTTKDSIIVQSNEFSAEAGHTVVFDYNGNISGRGVKGNTTARGTGEKKKKFSDKVVVSDYRWVVDNGTKFDGVEIGDLSINEHANSRELLTDLWYRISDQCYFDLGQQGSEFGIDLGSTFTFDQFLDIEQVIKEGTGFDTSPAGITTRMPLTPFYTADGRPIWLMVIDTAMKNKLLSSAGAQNLLKDADIRGNDNRLFKGVIGKLGNFVVVDASNFFGTSRGAILDNEGYFNYHNVQLEIAGLRKYDKTNSVWSGQAGYSAAASQKSRGLILGANAFQTGMGKMADYKLETYDFEKFSESAMEIWCGSKQTKLLAENDDYDMAKVAGYTFGSVFLDVTTK